MFEMTPNIFRNFFAKKATRLYPGEKRTDCEQARGEIRNEIGKCIFCGACALKCPSQCISVDKKAGLWQYDPFACVYCGVCTEACPTGSIHQRREYRPPVREREKIVLKGELKKRAEGETE